MSQQLRIAFESFSAGYDSDGKKRTWKQNSEKFRAFWNKRVLNEELDEINDAEIDEIVMILDKHAKGSTKDTESVARVMIPQGV